MSMMFRAWMALCRAWWALWNEIPLCPCESITSLNLVLDNGEELEVEFDGTLAEWVDVRRLSEGPNDPDAADWM